MSAPYGYTLPEQRPPELLADPLGLRPADRRAAEAIAAADEADDESLLDILSAALDRARVLA